MIFDKYKEFITWPAHYWLSRPDKENLLSFLKGYTFAKGKDTELINYMRLYLNEYHHIDMKFNTWEEQIDHYAYNHNLDWYQGFFHLVAEILNYKYILTPKDDYEKDFFHQIPKGERLEFVLLEDGSTLKVGDWIQLSDKIGEDYKQTKFYDATLRNPSWELWYPSEKDFSFIEFYYLTRDHYLQVNEITITTFGRLKRLFSQSVVEVQSIDSFNGKLFAYTDFLRIDINNAFKKEEFLVIDKKDEKTELTDFFTFKDKVNYFLIGFEAPLSKIINEWLFYNFSELGKNWQRYNRSINGVWHEITVH